MQIPCDSTNMSDSLQQILTELEAQASAATLTELGTLLRNEDVRAHPTAKKCIPHVLDLASTEPLEALRVLVNFTADNDDNRVYMVSNDVSAAEFWTWLFSQLHRPKDQDVCLRAILLLSQFVHNIQEPAKTTVVSALAEKGAGDAIACYLRELEQSGRLDDLVQPMELLSEISAVSTISSDNLQWITDAAARAQELDSEERSELLDFASQAIFNATNVDTRLGGPSTSQLYELLTQVSGESTHVKRRLFSACGNMSSYANHDNWAEVELNVHVLVDDKADPYVAAAAAIALGNCVDSKEKQQMLWRKLEQMENPDVIVDSLAQRSFGDLVQYQAFHFFSNAMTPSVASRLAEQNAGALMRATKVVVDNCNYYKEIAAVYFKFMRRFIAALDKTQLEPLLDLWALVEACDDASCAETQLLLLQALCHIPPTPLHAKLVAHAFPLEGNVDARLVLEKIKTLACVLHSYDMSQLSGCFSDFEHDFVAPLSGFLGQVQPSARAEHSAARALANNTKFLAASALKSAPSRSGPWGDLCARCEQILHKNGSESESLTNKSIPSS
ncbi:hypothetical protein EJF18_50494 [Clavispora lusitaniae]|uniref:Uncharacterized protein n=1 Tax=Clavispora lusitaniae TaxID=36911 RepID=A0ACD0WPJ0_CLALS|nr:hypothetical protein EJF14_50494 [Clavispora lusitaniae]QFZ34926.1 hypothetical protein EJF16_50494 [Clavispora lusitaniae]QFZ40611.1 hypothetical protein EJF15_50494 [Clavispora lusitaniae]QFZ46291.1 hypothetical protein EJF18_50494 [Clavispora lusitaniae]QFZ51953.1 hypothetical protein EJF17_50494 [Clavispora lusitaniae]